MIALKAWCRPLHCYINCAPFEQLQTGTDVLTKPRLRLLDRTDTHRLSGVEAIAAVHADLV